MLYILIILALLLLVLAIWALFWAIGNRQFDDLESQGWSVVLDDDQKPPQALPPAETGSSATDEIPQDDRTS
ncbi:MAG TPA: cbb3-type cytochrome oxidase assembly protein CcoS [Xanthomonadales bacterium]|nr:cbb3-type cytochrome oxidase assembly protein CcoS [Xanthomonadales bacterium]